MKTSWWSKAAAISVLSSLFCSLKRAGPWCWSCSPSDSLNTWIYFSVLWCPALLFSVTAWCTWFSLRLHMFNHMSLFLLLTPKETQFKRIGALSRWTLSTLIWRTQRAKVANSSNANSTLWSHFQRSPPAGFQDWGNCGLITWPWAATQVRPHSSALPNLPVSEFFICLKTILRLQCSPSSL